MAKQSPPKTASDHSEDFHEKERTYKLIFEFAPDAMFIGNSSGEFTDVNESATRLTGYSRSELIGMKMSSLFTREELDKQPLRYDLLKQGETVRIERYLAKKDGSVVPIEMNSRMLPSGALQAVIRDISVRKKMAQELGDLLNRQEVIVDTSFEAIFLSVDGKCVGQNKKAEEMFGYSEEEAIGRPATEWIVSEERHKVKNNILSGYERSYESVGLRKDGSSFPVEIQARMTSYGGKNVRVTALRDITLRKKAESDLLIMQKLESLGTLAGGLAHDLNNILTGLFGNLSLAKISLDETDPAHPFILRAEESLTRFTRITNKLLTFSKGGQPIVERADLMELAREIVEFDLSGSNVIPVFEAEQQLWYANVDKGQIQQVFSNLTINANQAMPDGGRLYCRFANCDNRSAVVPNLSSGLYVQVEVEDEGQGIAQENLETIFDPYYTTKPDGSGLGLTSVHSIVSQHKGLITVDSSIGQGTVFTIYLPASEDTDLSRKEVLMDKGDADIGYHRVLLVDDDDTVCSVGRSLLESLGCSVVIANNRSQAVDCFSRAVSEGRPFDIAILDLTIPGESGGADTVKQLLDIDQRTTMIVSSGYSDNPVMANFTEFGFSAILAKPYTLEKLREVLRLM